MFKKFISVMLVAVLAIGVVMAVPGKEASAANDYTIKQVTLYNFTDTIGSIATNEDYYYVYVSLRADYTWLRQKWDWTMYLQRYENGRWNTIGTRTGYLSYSSPSDRTFSNIAVKGAPMRVKVTYTPYYYAYYTDGTEGWRNDNQSGGSFTYYSKTWTR